MAMLKLPVGERDHSQGPADAKVTLVEYGDYECPHCGRAYPIVQEIQRRFEGRLRFVFRNFPLKESHAHAEAAAMAAEIAGEMGSFWPMHDMLFERQTALGNAQLVAYAQEIGLDGIEFKRRLLAHETQHRVNEDFVSGVKSGVNGTPTFFLNGRRYDDSWDVDTLSAAIDEALQS